MSDCTSSNSVSVEEFNPDPVNELEKKESNVTVTTVSQLPEPNYENISVIREILFMFFMCMSQLLTQAAVSQTMNTQLKIADTYSIQDDPGEMSWFAASFSMTAGTFILVSGRLGDMYGYKLLYIIGYLWFGVFSLLCGFAGLTKSNVFFTTMRGLQGIGPALMMPNSQALIASFYPESFKKNVCLALFGAIAPSGFVVGALFSGLLADLGKMAMDILVMWNCEYWLSSIGVFYYPKKDWSQV